MHKISETYQTDQINEIDQIQSARPASPARAPLTRPNPHGKPPKSGVAREKSLLPAHGSAQVDRGRICLRPESRRRTQAMLYSRHAETAAHQDQSLPPHPAKRRAMFQMTVYFQRLPHALLPRVAAGVSRRRCYEALRRRETTVALGEAAHMVRLGSKDEAAWCF